MPKEERREREQEGATYGEWQEGEFMEKDFWDTYLEERKSKLEKEEREREERVEEAGRQEQSWELARMCKGIIEETNSENWYQNKEIRKEKEKAEKEKQERFKVIKEKKKDLENRKNIKTKQVSLLEMMRKLPGKEREIIKMEERRMRRLDLQEIKQNIWRKWRGKGGSNEEKRKETEEEKIERQTTEIEKTKRREESPRSKVF